MLQLPYPGSPHTFSSLNIGEHVGSNIFNIPAMVLCCPVEGVPRLCFGILGSVTQIKTSIPSLHFCSNLNKDGFNIIGRAPSGIGKKFHTNTASQSHVTSVEFEAWTNNTHKRWLKGITFRKTHF